MWGGTSRRVLGRSGRDRERGEREARMVLCFLTLVPAVKRRLHREDYRFE